MKTLKKMFCKHENLEFIRNIYGDEINRISLKHIYRSIWQCKDCGKIVYKGKLGGENEAKNL